MMNFYKRENHQNNNAQEHPNRQRFASSFSVTIDPTCIFNSTFENTHMHRPSLVRFPVKPMHR